MGAEIVAIDRSGTPGRRIQNPNPLVLRIGHFAGVQNPVILSFSTWSRNVTAVDAAGKVLWTYPQGNSSGIDDVWAADLNGDGSDEVIVGFNGGTGLHVLDSNGQLQWKSTAIGNVWHVNSGDFRGDGAVQVVATSASGRLHFFDAKGAMWGEAQPGFYTNLVRAGRIRPTDAAATVFAIGSDSQTATTSVAALSADGARKWSLTLPPSRSPGVMDAIVASVRPWMAISNQAGQVFVVDTQKGTIIATIEGPNPIMQAAWFEDTKGSAPLLVVSTQAGLNAYRVEEK
jgi:hypothetical protein